MWTENNSLEDLVEGVLRHGPRVLDHALTTDDLSGYLSRLDQEKLNYPKPPETIDPKNWFIPREYLELDIEKHLRGCCPKENLDRLELELRLYKKHDMLPVLKAAKYIVDTLRKNSVVWGVGRGSSTASYVLHLLGVHRIDSVKYDLPIEEFFKEK